MQVEKLASIFDQVAVVSLKPNDVLVFRTAMTLSDAVRARVAEDLKDRIPAGTKVMILDGGADMAVLRIEGGG